MYGKQSNFTTPVGVGAGTRAFGMDQRVTQLSDNENKIELGDLYQQEVQKFAFGKFEGSLGVEWILSTPWWLDMVLIKSSTTGTGPYTHTYNDDKTVNAYTVEVGVNTTTPRVVQLQQLTAKDISISCSLNDAVHVRGNFFFGNTPTTAGTVVAGSIPADDILYPYTFVQATLENPSGTPLAEIQSFDLTINPNITQIYGMNSPYSVNGIKGKLSLTGKFTMTVKDNTWWNNVRARAEPSNNTLRMKFTNGLTSTNERTIQLTLTGLGLGDIGMTLDPSEMVTNEVSFSARSITAVVVNNTASPP